MINDTILVALIAVVLAQLLKYPIRIYKEGKADLKIIFSTGSMPSSHTAFVTAMSFEVGILSGFNSVDYGIAFILMIIVIHDAIKVRGESGRQAKYINDISEELKNLEKIFDFKVSPNIRKEKLKELIGHTPFEVLGGLFCGFIVFIIYNLI